MARSRAIIVATMPSIFSVDLYTTEGNVIHYGFIEKFIEELGERYNIREIAFDRWNATQMVQNLKHSRP